MAEQLMNPFSIISGNGSTQGLRYPLPYNINVTNFVTVKLSEGNYLIWKHQMLALLISQELDGFVMGHLPPPPSAIEVKEGENSLTVMNPEYQEWIRSDNLVKSWLSSTLTETILQVWEMLTNRFTQRTLAKEMELCAKLRVTTKENKTLDVYLLEMKHIFDQLSAIGKPVEETKRIYYLLDGLSPEYLMFKTTMIHTASKGLGSCYEDVVAELRTFELMNKKIIGETIDHNQVFYSQQGSFQRKNGNRNSQGRGGNTSRGFGRGRSNYSSKGRGFGQQSYTQNEKDSSNNKDKNKREPVTCQICRKIGHEAFRCWFRYVTDKNNQDDLPEALSALQVTDNDDSEWYPDTGASAHIINNNGYGNKEGTSKGTQV